MKKNRVFKPLTAEDILNCEPLPKTHDVRVDLYWCARGVCSNCSRKSEKGCKKTEIGGYVLKQPKNDGDGSGWYQWSYDYKIQEMTMGADKVLEEDDDDED